MPRKDLWESRLAELMAEAQDASFVWGEHDCALFACKGILALTGEDYGKAYRGRYATKAEAKVILEAEGGVKGIAEKIAKEMNFTVVDPLFAQRGDVALGDFDGQQTLGICVGRTFSFAVEPKGLVQVRLDSPLVMMVWRVG